MVTISIEYTCKKCETRVFEDFTPGGEGSVGKLLDVCRALHAEENAILNVSKIGRPGLKETVLYSTTFPCNLCANKIAQSGIKKVVYSETYTMKEALRVLLKEGVDISKFEGVKSSTFFKLYGS